jgi:DNA-binding MarR family transcriptional regulator
MGNDMTRLLKALEDQGFVVTRTGKGHWLVRNGER